MYLHTYFLGGEGSRAWSILRKGSDKMHGNGQDFHSQGTLGAKQNLCSNISQEIV